MTHHEIMLACSDERFSKIVSQARRQTREEIFRALGIRKATKRILDPVRRRNVSVAHLRAWMEKSPPAADDAAFRLLYDVLAGPLRPLIVAFLDGVGVEHEDGMADDLSAVEKLSVRDLQSVVTKLSETFGMADVALYLFFTVADPEMKGFAKTVGKIPELRAGLGS